MNRKSNSHGDIDAIRQQIKDIEARLDAEEAKMKRLEAQRELLVRREMTFGHDYPERDTPEHP